MGRRKLEYRPSEDFEEELELNREDELVNDYYLLNALIDGSNEDEMGHRDE